MGKEGTKAAKGAWRGSAKGATDVGRGGGERKEGEKHGSAGGSGSTSAKGSANSSTGGRGGRGSRGRSAAQAPTAAKAEAEKEADVSGKAGEEHPKHHHEVKGSHCRVRKHTDMGCAVVSMESEAAREEVLRLTRKPMGTDASKEARPEVTINGVTVQIRTHVDKVSQQKVGTDLFVAWGHKVEKQSPLPAQAIVEAFDALLRQARGLPPLPSDGPGGSQWAAEACFPGRAAAGVVPTDTALVAASALATDPGLLQLPQLTPSAAYGQMSPAMFGFIGHKADYSTMARQLQGFGQAAAMAMASQAATAPCIPGPVPSASATGPAEELPQAKQKPMNADAPAFMPPDVTTTFAAFDPNAVSSVMPESRALKIVDPKSGNPIQAPTVFEPQAFKRKPLEIKDPNDGRVLDMLGLNFAQAEGKQPLSIIDPASGMSIKI